MFSLSGCVALDGRESNTEGRTEPHRTGEETPTTTPPPAGEAFSVSASVVTQRTDDALPEVRLRLHNDASRTLSVSFGSALLFTDTSGDVAHADSLALDPESYGGYGGPDSPDDGCWRRESRETPQSTFFERTIPVGEFHEESYLVFTAPGESTCYPAGTHRFEDQIQYRDDEQFGIALVLTVDEDGTIRAVAEGPIPA